MGLSFTVFRATSELVLLFANELTQAADGVFLVLQEVEAIHAAKSELKKIVVEAFL